MAQRLAFKLPRMVFAAVIALVAILGARTAAAQPLARTPEELVGHVEPGSRVELIVGSDHPVVRGRLVDLTPTSIVLATSAGAREFPIGEVHEIWQLGRRPGRYLKGSFIGAGVGLALGGLAKAGEGDCNDPKSLCATDGPVRASDIAGAGVVGALTGVSVAWFRRGTRELVFLPAASLEGEQGTSEASSLPDQQWLALSESLKPGGLVEVDRGNARLLRAPVIEITPSSIVLLIEAQRYAVPRESVRKVWRDRDAWWHGPAAGLYFGTIWGLFAAGAICDRNDDACIGRAWGWATGIATAATTSLSLAYNHRALVYDVSRSRPTKHAVMEPLLGRRVIGINYSLTF
jgi:hypothetical protein